MKRLFIGNVSFKASEADVFEWFQARTGMVPVRVELNTDRTTGKARGFGFITLKESDDMDLAIEKTNGVDMQGRAMTVNVAKPKESRDGGRDRARDYDRESSPARSRR